VGGLSLLTPEGDQAWCSMSRPLHVLTKPHHLALRFFTSLSARPPDVADEVWAERHLLPGEIELWRRMSNQDRRHSAKVARRFDVARPEATRAEIAGALLHDVGKIECGLGTWGRVAASVVGSRTVRFRAYHDHEHIGSLLAESAGSDPATVELIDERGPAYQTLRSCDHA
jgi:hypothetical protein